MKQNKTKEYKTRILPKNIKKGDKVYCSGCSKYHVAKANKGDTTGGDCMPGFVYIETFSKLGPMMLNSEMKRLVIRKIEKK